MTLLAALPLVQLVPLPFGVLELVSPQAAEIRRATELAGIGVPAWAPLSLDPGRTLFRAAQLLTMLAVYRAVASRARSSPARAAAPLVALAAAQAVLGLAQHLQRHESLAASGSYANRNHFAGLLEMALPLGIALAVIFFAQAREDFNDSAANWLFAGLSATAAGLILCGLLLSYSRGAFLSLLLGAVVAFFALVVRAVRRSPGRPVRRRLASRAILGCGAVMLLLALAPGRLVDRFALLGEDAGSPGRIELFTETADLIADYPLLGCGLGAYESCFSRYKRSGAAYRDRFAHNDYLQLAAELGLPALALALAACGLLLRSGMRAALGDRSTVVLAGAGLASVAALLAHSLVDFNLYIPANALVFSWTCGILAGCGSKDCDHG